MDISFEYLKEIGLWDCPVEGTLPAVARAEAATATCVKQQPASADVGVPSATGAAPAGPPPEELSPEELAKMTKAERTAYFLARRAAGATPAPKAKQMSKAERRAAQEGQRKAKEDKKAAAIEDVELLEELKLQGLSEDQAREVMAEIARTGGDQAAEDEPEEDEPEDLLSSVRKWLADQGDKVPDEALHDFNMKVRFQGHVDTTPPDHLEAILTVLTSEALRKCDLNASKLQPTAVAGKVEPSVKRWAPLLEPLYGKIGDPMEAADVVLGAVLSGAAAQGEVPEAGRACGIVGCLMAIREIDMIEDEDLLTGCKRCAHRSVVMDKFIDFLEEELEEDEEDEEEDD